MSENSAGEGEMERMRNEEACHGCQMKNRKRWFIFLNPVILNVWFSRGVFQNAGYAE